MTLRLLALMLLFPLAAGCAGAAAAQRGDTPSLSSATQPPADVVGPSQRYPLRSQAPAVPKLTIADADVAAQPPSPMASQATATAELPPTESFFSPPAPAIAANEAGQIDPPTPPEQAGPREQELFAPGQIVARVADQIILYGDVSPMADQTLAPHLAKAKSAAEREEILSQREVVVEQLVRSMIETKLLYYEALREVPRDKLEEAKGNMRKQVGAGFESQLKEARREVAAVKKEELESVLRKDPVVMRLAWMMNEQGLETMGELDAALRQQGSSLVKQIAFYTEYHFGRSIIPKNIDFRPEVTHQEMLDYYREHAAEFAIPAKARFEIMTVYYKNYPAPEAAEQELAAMGNAVYLGGASFAAVAQKSSQEPGAANGGQYGWTSKGSLASEAIDEAIFTLPLGRLSQMLRDNRGCHILRVHERQDAGQIPFVEAQAKIKDAIVSQKRNAEYKEYLEGLRESIPVWTIYDDRKLAREQHGPVSR